jgi:hypothetical protein
VSGPLLIKCKIEKDRATQLARSFYIHFPGLISYAMLINIINNWPLRLRSSLVSLLTGRLEGMQVGR